MPDITDTQLFQTLLSRYGLWFLLALGLFLERKTIAGLFSGLVEKIAPSLAHRFKSSERHFEVEAQERLKRLEAEIDERMRKVQADAQERIDSMLLVKDMVIELRQRAVDAELSRRQAEHETRDVIRGYEKLSAQVVEVLRDISESLRAQTNRLDEMEDRRDDRKTAY